MKRFLGVFLALSFLLGGSSAAFTPAHGLMIIVNETNYEAWVTTYNFARKQINYGWVHPHDKVGHNNCCYVAGSSYYVRAEVKETINGVMHQIADTTIHVVPKLCRTGQWAGKTDGDPYGYARVILRQGHGKTFYFDRDDRSNCTW